jgi:hypothetical protein
VRLTDTEIVRGGYEMLDAAMAEYREGRSVDLDTASQLAALLTRLRYRDHAWAVIAHDPQHAPCYRVMWQEIAHAAQAGQAAAPAMLLAWVDWQDGDNAGAVAAVDWALAEQAGYRAACMIRTGIALDVPRDALMPIGTRAVRLFYDDTLARLAVLN